MWVITVSSSLSLIWVNDSNLWGFFNNNKYQYSVVFKLTALPPCGHIQEVYGFQCSEGFIPKLGSPIAMYMFSPSGWVWKTDLSFKIYSTYMGARKRSWEVKVWYWEHHPLEVSWSILYKYMASTVYHICKISCIFVLAHLLGNLEMLQGDQGVRHQKKFKNH